MKTKDLYKLEDLVTTILQENIETRKDDFLLIAEVYRTIDPTIISKSFAYVMLHHKDYRLPYFESIRRTRQKIQAKRPELKDIITAEARFEEQNEYERYAIGG